MRARLLALAAALALGVATTTAASGATERVSIDSSGTQGNSSSGLPAISGDGRYVAFWSNATNLDGTDANGAVQDVYVHDRQTGTTTRVSVDSSGTQSNNASFESSFSADGRYIAFRSHATNLVSGDANGFVADVYVHDRQTGTTTRVSINSSGAQGNQSSFNPVISADGRYVVFDSNATNLDGTDANGTVPDVYVHDRQTGTTTRVSVDSSGAQGNDSSFDSSISADGRYVAFRSHATNLVGTDANGTAPDVYVHDRQTGTTTRVSVDSSGAQGNQSSAHPGISADGRYVAFYSEATNLDGTDANGTVRDVYVHDRQTGTTTRVSINSSGAQGNQSSSDPVISADGRYVAFTSFANNLDGTDTNGVFDVYVHDRQTGTTTRVSVDSSGTQSNNSSDHPSISADGRYVAFASHATNLDGTDANGTVPDVYVTELVVDADADGIADDADNCPDDANSDQTNTDGDEEGDACDADDDNDTVADGGDNCPLDANSDQADADGDHFGDVCDSDDDDDGVIDGADACVPTATGAVVNGDGCAIADLCPCDNPWKNHGAYVSCTTKASEEFLDFGLITEAEKDAIVSAAGQSQCGKNN